MHTLHSLHHVWLSDQPRLDHNITSHHHYINSFDINWRGWKFSLQCKFAMSTSTCLKHPVPSLDAIRVIMTRDIVTQMVSNLHGYCCDSFFIVSDVHQSRNAGREGVCSALLAGRITLPDWRRHAGTIIVLDSKIKNLKVFQNSSWKIFALLPLFSRRQADSWIMLCVRFWSNILIWTFYHVPQSATTAYHKRKIQPLFFQWFVCCSCTAGSLNILQE